MKTPPLLLTAVLLFWGWQSGFLLAGAALGVVLEGARFTRLRWDLTEEDFRRVWSLCTLLSIGLIIYTFSTGGAGGGAIGPPRANAIETTRNLSFSAHSYLRWLPATLFLFIAAQKFSERGVIPLAAISFFARRQKDGVAAERSVDVSYPYFILCLFSAGIHDNTGTQSYFWGLASLLGWALWPLRSRRFGAAIWAAALAVVIGLGFTGQHGLGEMQRLIEGYNAQWLANMMRHRTDASQSETTIGQIGRLKLSPRIIIRLQPKDGRPPGYLREASYRNYHPQHQAWYAGGSPGDFTDISHEPENESSWTLLPGKNSPSEVHIAAYLEGRSPETGYPEGLLPLPSGCSRLQNLPVFTLKMNPAGAVLASGLGLVMFDARFGPGATIDSAPDTGTNHLDQLVPVGEVPALNQVIAEMKISGASRDRKLLAVQQFFADKFSYSMWAGADKLARGNETPLARFLLQSRCGHCEYFATATVLLLRQLGIPARYAVGYAVHEPSGNGYVVRERDAHAWCLVWDEGTKTWQDFDTTPASWVAIESQRASALQWISDLASRVRFEFARLRWSQTNLREYLLWALAPVLAILVYQIFFRRRRQRRRHAKISAVNGRILWPGLDSEFYPLERRLASRGVPRQASEPLAGWLSRALADPVLEDLREPLQGLLQLHYRHRFDPRGLSVAQREALAREAKICLEAVLQRERRIAPRA